jgi:hypothetical protein
VPLRVPSLADRLEPLLVVGILAMMLGLGTAGLGLVDPERLPGEAAAGSSSPARTVSPGAASSPLTIGDRFHGDPACHSEHPHVSRSGSVSLASIVEDPRQYLGKMAAMRHRRRVSTATVDPYLASLNPAVYLAGAAAPIAHDGSPTSPPHDRLCRFP